MTEPSPAPADLTLELLRRFQQEGVEYVLVGGQAVRLNGFVRVADELLIDPLFAANGETYESLQPFVRELQVEGVTIKLLNIEGLLKSKTDYRDKDLLDKAMLRKLRDRG
jgi:hypothetical protein